MRTVVSLLLLLPILTFAQDEDCIYDQSTQTDEFIHDVPEFTDYEWNNDTKEAIISLPNNESLIVKRGGCFHFGISAELRIPETSKLISDLEYWFKRAQWISERLFDEDDYNIIRKSINDGTFSDMSTEQAISIWFPHDYYDMFSMVALIDNDTTILRIGYYY